MWSRAGPAPASAVRVAVGSRRVSPATRRPRTVVQCWFCGNLPCTCESSTLRENEISPEARPRGAAGRGVWVLGRATRAGRARGTPDTTTSIFLSKITRMIVARQSCYRSVCTHAPGQLRPELRPLVRAFHDAGTLAPPDTTTKSSPRGSGGSGSGSGSPSARSSSRIAAHSSSALGLGLGLG